MEGLVFANDVSDSSTGAVWNALLSVSPSMTPGQLVNILHQRVLLEKQISIPVEVRVAMLQAAAIALCASAREHVSSNNRVRGASGLRGS
jgi:hypothetical protein